MNEFETIERDEIARKNREELLRLVAQWDLWIRKNDFDNWRPTVRVEGEITGIRACLTIIATDGNVAYFEDGQTGDVFFGHIQCFTGVVRTLFSMPKEGVIKEARPKKKRETTMQRAMRLLAGHAEDDEV